jgi:hypothetical protein
MRQVYASGVSVYTRSLRYVLCVASLLEDFGRDDMGTEFFISSAEIHLAMLNRSGGFLFLISNF